MQNNNEIQDRKRHTFGSVTEKLENLAKILGKDLL
jgi:hypothetical protein